MAFASADILSFGWSFLEAVKTTEPTLPHSGVPTSTPAPAKSSKSSDKSCSPAVMFSPTPADAVQTANIKKYCSAVSKKTKTLAATGVPKCYYSHGEKKGLMQLAIKIDDRDDYCKQTKDKPHEFSRAECEEGMKSVAGDACKYNPVIFFAFCL